MSQKNGSVTSHVRISEKPRSYPARIPSGEADVVLACDILTSGARDAVSKMRLERTYVIANNHQQPTGAFATNPEWQFPGQELAQVIRDAVGERAFFIDATAIATKLLGDSIATNLFMLGFSYQKGLIPISEEAIARAIELNGVAVQANKKAFRWGRHAAVDMDRVRLIAQPSGASIPMRASSLDQQIEDRVRELTAYQNAAYAKTYLDLVERVRRFEERTTKSTELTSVVSKFYFKLMAYKDEYEVARLYTDGRFRRSLANQFDGKVSLRFNLAAPLFAKRDAEGRLLKREYGAWIWHAFRVLAKLKFLRGTPLDIFGYTAERRTERELVSLYQSDIEKLLETLDETNLREAVEFASWPDHVRGYGHVKEKSVAAMRTKRRSMLERVKQSISQEPE
jgi:indolepyruvate ferredoxin oxidoreductase